MSHSKPSLRFQAIIATVFVLAISACTSVLNSEDLVAAGLISEKTSNKAVITRFMENRLTMPPTELAREFFADDYQEVRFEFENLSYNVQDSALAKQAQPLDQAISNRTDTLDVVIGEGSSVAVRYAIKGKHAGNLYGIPATEKDFEIMSVAIFELSDGKITESWFMADEVKLLRTLGTPMPTREDGKYRIPPVGGETAIAADDILAQMLASPENSREYRNRLNVASRKANNPPPGYTKKSVGLSYDEILRYGFQNVTDIGNETNTTDLSFGKAFSERIDRLDYFLMDDDWIFIRFRLTANNTGSLFGLPILNGPVDAWEVAFMKFEEEHWRTAWWFGDDQSLLMQLEGPQSFWFPEVSAPE